MEELKRFEKDLKNNEELSEKLDEAVKRIADEGQAKSDGEIMVMAAKELGYGISIAALEQARAEAEHLDSAELAKVSGGVDNRDRNGCQECTNYICSILERALMEDEHGHEAWCYTAWHCFTVTLHTEAKDTDAKCWEDYTCLWINK